MDNLQSEKDDLKNKIEETNTYLSSVEDNIIGEMSQIEKLNAQIAKYQEELNASKVKVAQTQMSVTAITTELQEAEKKYTYQKKFIRATNDCNV